MRWRRAILALIPLAATPAVAGQVRAVGTETREVVGSAAALAVVRESAVRAVARAQQAEAAGHTLDAEVQYHRAMQLDAGLLDAHLGYARCLAARGRRDEAIAALEALGPRAVSTADASTLAQALVALRAPDAALTILRARTGQADTHRAIATLCAELGRFAEALAAARAWHTLAHEASATARDTAAESSLWVRALERLVAEADAVRSPGISGEPIAPLRRVLATTRLQ